MQTFFKTLLISTFIFSTRMVHTSSDGFLKAETAPAEITSLTESVENTKEFSNEPTDFALPQRPPSILAPQALKEYQTFLNFVENDTPQKALAMLKSSDFSCFQQWKDYSDPQKGTPLILVLSESFDKEFRDPYVNLATELIHQGVDVTIPLMSRLGATTPLMGGSSWGDLELVQLILDQTPTRIREAYINQQGSIGRAFQLALWNNDEAVVKLLLKEGAMFTNNDIMYAFNKGIHFYEETVTLLAAKKRLAPSEESFKGKIKELFSVVYQEDFIRTSLKNLEKFFSTTSENPFACRVQTSEKVDHFFKMLNYLKKKDAPFEKEGLESSLFDPIMRYAAFFNNIEGDLIAPLKEYIETGKFIQIQGSLENDIDTCRAQQEREQWQ